MIKDKNEVGSLEVSISKEKAAKTKDTTKNSQSKSITNKYSIRPSSGRKNTISRNNSNKERINISNLNRSSSQQDKYLRTSHSIDAAGSRSQYSWVDPMDD